MRLSRKVTFDRRYKDAFGDLWLRARHNALANLEAAHDAKKEIDSVQKRTAILITVPIFCLTLAEVWDELKVLTTIVSGVCSIIALYLTLVGTVQEKRSNYFFHSRAHGIFNNIAQKCRRAAAPSLDDSELKYLLRSLEEMFETAKYNMQEPTDRNYDSAFCRMLNMPKWPFGLDKDKFAKDFEDKKLKPC